MIKWSKKVVTLVWRFYRFTPALCWDQLAEIVIIDEFIVADDGAKTIVKIDERESAD
jgi:hypothetical protein